MRVLHNSHLLGSPSHAEICSTPQACVSLHNVYHDELGFCRIFNRSDAVYVVVVGQEGLGVLKLSLVAGADGGYRLAATVVQTRILDCGATVLF